MKVDKDSLLLILKRFKEEILKITNNKYKILFYGQLDCVNKQNISIDDISVYKYLDIYFSDNVINEHCVSFYNRNFKSNNPIEYKMIGFDLETSFTTTIKITINNSILSVENDTTWENESHNKLRCKVTKIIGYNK